MRRVPGLCPKYQKAVELLGKRWTPLVVQLLLERPHRFAELVQELEVVSERVLSERLKELEAEGVLERRVFTAAPIGVVYELTRKGRALEPVVTSIAAWAERWADQAPASRRKRAPASAAPDLASHKAATRS